MSSIVFIASLDHSGSTMLDLMLGSHSRLVGLGEVELVIKNFIDGSRDGLLRGVCSCGSIGSECAFWSRVIARWDDTDEMNYESGYRAVLFTFDELFGDAVSLVDSSKYISALKTVRKVAPARVKVLHLLKDVRSFTVSRLDRIRERDNRTGLFLPFKQFASWYRVNKRLASYLSSSDIDHFRLGYEEICLDTRAIMKTISHFIGVDYEESTLRPSQSDSHCLHGNRMRLQSDKRNVIYDSRWFTRTEWVLPSVIFKNVMTYNYANVYSNNVASLFQR